jgi:hypothetical protein
MFAAALAITGVVLGVPATDQFADRIKTHYRYSFGDREDTTRPYFGDGGLLALLGCVRSSFG